jgi:hypothetical protein
MTPIMGGTPTLSPREDEFLIWEGKPDYRPRRILFTIVGIGFVSLGIVFLDLRGVGGENLQIIPAILLITNLSIIFGDQGTSYYITSRRIVKEWSLVVYKRKREILLETLADITIKRRSKRGFLTFRTPEDGTINFSLLKEDPDHIRQIAIDAKAKLNSSG